MLDRCHHHQCDPGRPGKGTHVSLKHGPTLENGKVSSCADPPRLGSDLEDDEVPAVKDGDDDEEDQEQETDEEHQRLDHHSCPHRTHNNKYTGSNKYYWVFTEYLWIPIVIAWILIILIFYFQPYLCGEMVKSFQICPPSLQYPGRACAQRIGDNLGHRGCYNY